MWKWKKIQSLSWKIRRINHSSFFIFEIKEIMEIYEIEKQYADIKQRFSLIKAQLDLDKINKEISQYQELEKAPDFWNDNHKASKLLKDKQKLIDKIEAYQHINTLINDFAIYLDYYNQKEMSLADLNEEFTQLEIAFNQYEMNSLLNDKYDDYNAYLEIHPGAGGTESQDWANMVLDMYLRFCKQNDFKTKIIDMQTADVGIKSVLIEISGTNAYGLLKGENGIHRLVRISPFDSNKKRHTSFCSVKVMPVIEEDNEIEINEKDLKIDRYRSSGAGGQSVNTTDSAIRITHIPTNIIVTCQNERSQIQNKNQALKILQAKLLELKLQNQQMEKNKLAGNNLEIGWGSQKRSYVLHPYKMVKDNISGYETSQADKILNGEINDLLYYNLISKNKPN